MRYKYLILIIVAIVTTWITKVIHRRRMERALGRKVGDSELTSLKAWSEVLDAEEKGENKPK